MSEVFRSSTYTCPSLPTTIPSDWWPGRGRTSAVSVRWLASTTSTSSLPASAMKARLPSDEKAMACGPDTTSPKALPSAGFTLTVNRASCAPVGSRRERAGNTVSLKTSAGCGVSIPSIRCATHVSFVPGRASTS
jgi:hypothetical protein